MSKPSMVLIQIVIACGAAAGAMAQQPEAPKKPDQPAAQPEAKAEEVKTAPDGDAKPPERRVEWIVKFPNELDFSSGFDDVPGGVSVTRTGAEFEVDIPIEPRGELDLGFGYEHSWYQFSQSAALIPGVSSPFQNINKETFRASFGKQQTRQLGWSVGGSIAASAEDGADLGDAIVGTAYAGVGYYLNEHLKIGVAMAVATRLDQYPLILPLPSLNWEINDRWRLSTAGQPGLTLFYKPSEDWTLSLGGGYESRNFRLDKSGPVPDGVGRDTSVPLRLGAVFKPTKNISIEFGGGVKLLQNYRVDDSGGNTLADVDGDPVPFLSFRLGLSF